jgi:hypothetical protein
VEKSEINPTPAIAVPAEYSKAEEGEKLKYVLKRTYNPGHKPDYVN